MVFMALSFRLGTAVSRYFVFGLRYVLRINLNGTLGNALTGDPTLFEKHWTGAGCFCGASYFRHVRLNFFCNFGDSLLLDIRKDALLNQAISL